jgi:hypothetical protein
MKTFILLILFTLFSMAANGVTEEWSKKFEDLVSNEIRSKNIIKVSVSTRIFSDENYYNLDNLVSLDSQQNKRFIALLDKIEWHDSLSVSSRSDAEFMIVLETRGGNTYGLHATNGLESDCFHLVQITLGKESYVTHTYFLQKIKKIDGRIKPFNRVLKISGWRTTEEGRKILALVTEHASQLPTKREHKR